jgi:hypothetical protein
MAYAWLRASQQWIRGLPVCASADKAAAPTSANELGQIGQDQNNGGGKDNHAGLANFD